MVPLLASWGRLRMKKSVGTSLVIITAVVAVGLGAQLATRPTDVDGLLAGLLVVGALGGAPVGRWLLRILPRRAFRYVFAGFLVLVAVRMFGVVPQTSGLIGDAPGADTRLTIVYTVGVGFLAGVSSALFGIGGGMVIVPALMIGFTTHSEHFAIARATSLAAIVPISAWSTYLHWRRGNVRLSLARRLLPAATAFAILGVLASFWLEANLMKLGLGTLLVGVAAKVALQPPREETSDDDAMHDPPL